MCTIKIHPLQKPIQAEVTLPGSLSDTIRALNIAAMIKGSVRITNALKSDDTYAMANILKTLGITVEEGEGYFTVHGDISDIQNKAYELHVNISGRTARIALALLCIVPGEKTLTCQEAFKKRPIGDLVDGLRQLGAEISYLEQEGHLPVHINSQTLSPGIVKMNGKVSSQYFSAIMMIAPMIGEIRIEVIGKQASRPFIDITTDIMKTFGVNVINHAYKQYIIPGNQQYAYIPEYLVEADAIAASYFWGIAAVTQSTIKILHLSPRSPQGDIYFADILGSMGCLVEKNEQEQWIAVTGTNNLQAITVDMNDTPDSVLTLAVVAAFAKGTTHITGLSHLKVKETDRIEAPKKELEKMGIEVSATNDSLTITGGAPHGAEIETHDDHRVAMAFAVAGSKIAGIEIKNPDVVNKSFPEFWKTVEKLGIGIEKK